MAKSLTGAVNEAFGLLLRRVARGQGVKELPDIAGLQGSGGGRFPG
jgi:hypothetical protein